MVIKRGKFYWLPSSIIYSIPLSIPFLIMLSLSKCNAPQQFREEPLITIAKIRNPIYFFTSPMLIDRTTRSLGKSIELVGYPAHITLSANQFTQILTEPMIEPKQAYEYSTARPSLGLAVCNYYTGGLTTLVSCQLGLQRELLLNRNIIREARTQSEQSPSIQHNLIKQLIRLVSTNNTLMFTLYPRPNANSLFYLSWSVDWLCYSLFFNGKLVLFDDKSLVCRDVSLLMVCQRLLGYLKRLDKLDLEHFKLTLLQKTFIGEIKSDHLCFHSIICNRTRRNLPVSFTQGVFRRFSLPYNPTLFDLPSTCNNQWDITSKLTELQQRVTRNRHCFQHKILRIVCEDEIVAEFTLKSRERMVFEQMEGCVLAGEQFTNQHRYYFPAEYYNEIYRKIGEFPQCGLGFEDRVKVVQYCNERNCKIERVVNSQYLHKICEIDSSHFENWDQGTYLIYLFLGPVGLGKTQLFQLMQLRAKQFGCQTLLWKKDPDSRLGLLHPEPLQHFLLGSRSHFVMSPYSIILVDYPFYQQLPQQLSSAFQRLTPANNHYKIFHILPDCRNRLVFEDDILHRNMEFPFSTEVIIHCLRNVQKRRDNDGLNGSGVESLAKALHYVCAAWKNFKLESIESERQRLIKIPYEVVFQTLNPTITLYLQQLLSMSYKKHYDKNQHLLYYFLQQIEQLAEQSTPDPAEVCQTILSQSFHRPTYYPIQ